MKSEMELIEDRLYLREEMKWDLQCYKHAILLGWKLHENFRWKYYILIVKTIKSLFSHQGILDIREFVWNTYEKLEMDADWWKNDAAKVNEMECATVRSSIKLNLIMKVKSSNKNLQWK